MTFVPDVKTLGETWKKKKKKRTRSGKRSLNKVTIAGCLIKSKVTEKSMNIFYKRTTSMGGKN